jgi:hypothetical protein
MVSSIGPYLKMETSRYSGNGLTGKSGDKVNNWRIWQINTCHLLPHPESLLIGCIKRYLCFTAFQFIDT